MTPAGIKPATFRFVAQHLSHWATAVPPCNKITFINSSAFVGFFKIIIVWFMHGTWKVWNYFVCLRRFSAVLSSYWYCLSEISLIYDFLSGTNNLQIHYNSVERHNYQQRKKFHFFSITSLKGSEAPTASCSKLTTALRLEQKKLTMKCRLFHNAVSAWAHTGSNDNTIRQNWI